MHCPIASNSNLATYLDHLVVGQFQNICNTNGVARHRCKDSFLPTWDTSLPLARYDRFLYKQAIKRVFAKKYHDELMAVYWGREDDAIHVITTLRHYVHKIASENEDTLEFVSSVGDRIVVALTDEERRQLERAG